MCGSAVSRCPPRGRRQRDEKEPVRPEEINARLVFRCDSSTRFCNPATEHGGAGRGERHPGVQRHRPPSAAGHLDQRGPHAPARGPSREHHPVGRPLHTERPAGRQRRVHLLRVQQRREHPRRRTDHRAGWVRALLRARADHGPLPCRDPAPQPSLQRPCPRRDPAPAALPAEPPPAPPRWSCLWRPAPPPSPSSAHDWPHLTRQPPTPAASRTRFPAWQLQEAVCRAVFMSGCVVRGAEGSRRADTGGGRGNVRFVWVHLGVPHVGEPGSSRGFPHTSVGRRALRAP